MSRALILICLAMVGSIYAATINDFKAPEVTFDENGDIDVEFFHDDEDLADDRVLLS